jgi:uncharacterized OB-fold protein
VSQIPLVDYLVLGDDPHLVANECTACGARFFDRRNACAACEATSFERKRVPSEGEVQAFTIVSFAAPGVPVPFVASVVDCDGTSVRGNLVNVDPVPEHVKPGVQRPGAEGARSGDTASPDLSAAEPTSTTVSRPRPYLGMKVKLTTVPVGADSAGTEAIGFGFEPIEGS